MIRSLSRMTNPFRMLLAVCFFSGVSCLGQNIQDIAGGRTDVDTINEPVGRFLPPKASFQQASEYLQYIGETNSVGQSKWLQDEPQALQVFSNIVMNLAASAATNAAAMSSLTNVFDILTSPSFVSSQKTHGMFEKTAIIVSGFESAFRNHEAPKLFAIANGLGLVRRKLPPIFRPTEVVSTVPETGVQIGAPVLLSTLRNQMENRKYTSELNRISIRLYCSLCNELSEMTGTKHSLHRDVLSNLAASAMLTSAEIDQIERRFFNHDRSKEPRGETLQESWQEKLVNFDTHVKTNLTGVLGK